MESDGEFKLTDFEKFQVYFTKYQKLFGLTGYQVYFKYESLEKSFASIDINYLDAVATVRLNSQLPDKSKPFKDIKKSAKHEAIHLLIGKLELLGHERFLNSNQLYEADEELVAKLENLIGDN